MPRLVLLLSLAVLACGVQTAIPQPIATDTAQPLAIQPTAPPESAVVIADSLNVRECGAYECASVGKWLRRGETVAVYERDGDWCRVGAGEWVACWWIR
jgi:hypothetical protein